MINLNDIQIFICAAHAGTLNRAARTLGIPPSTISRAITRLEKALELQLIRRTSRGISLTEVGRDYLNKCDAALAELGAAHEMLGASRARPRGTIRLAVTTIFARDVLTPVLKHFIRRYPEIHLQIIFHNSKFSTALDDNLDFRFQIGKPKDSSLKVKMFRPIRRRIYASPSYVEQYGLPTDPADLREHSCIGYAVQDSAIWRLSSKNEKQSVKLLLRVSVADPMIHRQLALDGLGIAQLPVWVALPEVEAGGLIAVLPEWQSEPLYFHALYAERSSMTPKIKAFLEFIEEFIATE